MSPLFRTTHHAPRRAVFRAATTVSLALASLALAACGGGGDDPDVGTPAHIELVGTAPTATVGGLVTPPPGVKVTDAEGRVVPNVNVTFTATGGGTMTDGVQRTNAQGVASVGSWRLGTVAGSGNTLVATSGTVSTTITATATAAVAAIHEAAPGQPSSQAVQPSTQVSTRPAVRVTDAYGNPKSGMVVTFAPSAGSGTVTGGLQTTNSEGIATVGSWTVGSTTGQQTLVANVSGATLPSVTFVAVVGSGNTNACTAVAYTLGSTVNGSLATTDCPFGDGTLVDLYAVTSAGPVNHEFRLQSTAFDAFLWAYDANIDILGAADDESDASTNARMRLIAPAGQYLILANSYAPDETGPYTLSSSTGARPAGCDGNTWIVPGVTWSESVAASDCPETNGTGTATRGDEYGMFVRSGRTVTVTLRSTAMDVYLRILRVTSSDAVLHAQDDNGAGGTDARVTLTAPTGSEETLFVIIATTAAGNVTGAYTVEVSGATALVAGAPTRENAGRPVMVGPRAPKGTGALAASPWSTLRWGAKATR